MPTKKIAAKIHSKTSIEGLSTDKVAWCRPDVAESQFRKLQDLEPLICDLAQMAQVTTQMFEHLMEEEHFCAEAPLLAMTAKGLYDHLTTWREAAEFSVHHMQQMALKLKREFYKE